MQFEYTGIFTSFRSSEYLSKVASFEKILFSIPNFPGNGEEVPVAMIRSVYLTVSPLSKVTLLFFESNPVAFDLMWHSSSLAV